MQPHEHNPPLGMTAVENRAARWHHKHFGDGVDLPATFRKLCEEIGELGEALMFRRDLTGGDVELIEQEAADCALILCHIVRGINGNARGSLSRAMNQKMRIVENRNRPYRGCADAV